MKMYLEDAIKLLEKYDNAYYNDVSIVSDEVYDALKKDVLDKLPANHPLKSKVGHKIQGGWTKVAHEQFMGSQNKVHTEEDINQWVLNAQKKLKINSLKFVVQFKIDGLSFGCYYTKGVLRDVVSRGDGIIGESLIKNAVNFKGIVHTLPIEKNVSIRGEGLLTRDNFDKIQKITKNQYKNARNAASGISRRYDGSYSHFLSFLAFDVNANVKTEIEKIEVLKRLGFNVVPTYLCNNVEEVLKIYRDVKNNTRRTLPYNVDGLVLKINSIEYQEMLGIERGRPVHQVAMKFDPEGAITEIKDVLLQIGRTGKITPIALLNPIDLDGSTVSKATLHNFDYIEESNIGIGATVSISKRGDIIPQIEEILNPGDIYIRPTVCPSCGGPLIWDQVNLWCENEGCREREINKILYWIKVLDMKGFSLSFVEKLWDTGKIKRISDLYSMNPDSLLSIDGLGAKTIKSFFETLENKKEMYLEQFIVALGIPGASKGTAEDLVKYFGTWDNILKVRQTDLLKISGYAEVSAETVCSGIAEVADMAKELLKVIKIKDKRVGTLTGVSLCVTGSLETMSRKEFEDLVINEGGSFKSGIAAGLNYLVTNTPDSGSGKNSKVIYLNKKFDDEGTPEKKIKIITEKEFIKIAKIEIKSESSDTKKDGSPEPNLEFIPLFQ